jgi:hypothetical protein
MLSTAKINAEILNTHNIPVDISLLTNAITGLNLSRIKNTTNIAEVINTI